MSKILITGASGFLGRHLIPALLNNDHEVVAPSHSSCDLTDSRDLSSYAYCFWKNISFDFIFHLAAWTKAGDFCLHHPAEQFVLNQKMNTNILDYWQKHQASAKMIIMGTSCAYDHRLPMSSENYLKGEPDESLYSYAMTKRMLLVGAQAYAKQYGLKYLCYVPSTLYGDSFDLQDSHFIFDLIKKICDAKFANTEPVVLWGNGHQKRELVLIDDAITAMINSLSEENQIINLCSGVEHSIREYALMICSIVEYDFSKIQFDESKFTGVLSKRLIPGKYFVKPNLLDGIAKVTNYYLKAKKYV